MTRILRFAVGRVLVVAVVVAVVAGCAFAGREAVPVALVGLWRGGAHTNGEWCYEFSSDGAYRAWPLRGTGTVNAGTVVVDDTTILFSNGGAPVRSTWSVSDGVLFLDGQRYVRA